MYCVLCWQLFSLIVIICLTTQWDLTHVQYNNTHTHARTHAHTHTHTHTIKPPTAGVQLVGHTSIIIYTVYHLFVATTRAKLAVILRHKSFFCSSVALHRQNFLDPTPLRYRISWVFPSSPFLHVSLPLSLKYCC